MKHIQRVSAAMPQMAFIEKGFRIVFQFGDVDRRRPDGRSGKFLWLSF